jgi:hypothetical protein
MWHDACKNHKLDAKGPPIESPLLFVYGIAHVKSISWMIRDHQSGAPYSDKPEDGIVDPLT